jgi:hypothetical protein
MKDAHPILAAVEAERVPHTLTKTLPAGPIPETVDWQRERGGTGCATRFKAKRPNRVGSHLLQPIAGINIAICIVNVD